MQELIRSWWRLLTQARAEIFAEEGAKASFPRLALVIVLIAVLSAIIVPQSTGTGMAKWIAIVTTVVYVLAAYFAIALTLFIVARLFGGKGGVLCHFYVIGVLTIPNVVVLGSIGHIDIKQALLALLSPLGIITIILFLIVIYSLLLLFLAVDGIHNLGGRKAVRVVGIAILLLLVADFVYIILAGIKNTLVNYFIYIWGQRIDLLQLSVDHAEIVLFSMSIAISLGIIIGILITLPAHKVAVWHSSLLIPLAIFAFLWFGSIGMLGPDAKAWLGKDGVIGQIIARPQAIGIVGIILMPILYALYVTGEKAADLVLYTAGVLLTIPSIALFGIFIPIFGIGFFNAAVALILYAQLPILRNTYTGIKEVPPSVIESARGMGMTEWEILYKVKVPLAMPVIMAGIRISMVMIVGIAAIATLIGVDVLGRYIFDGMQRISDRMVFAGAVAVSIFAILVDILLGWGEQALTPAGMRKKSQRSEAQ